MLDARLITKYRVALAIYTIVKNQSGNCFAEAKLIRGPFLQCEIELLMMLIEVPCEVECINLHLKRSHSVLFA